MAHAVSSTQGSSNPLPAFIPEMPHEITALFFEWLGIQDVGACNRVCRTWNALIGLDSLWKALLANHFPNRTIALQEGETYLSDYKKLHHLISNCEKARWTSSILPDVTVACKSFAAMHENLILPSHVNGEIQIFNTRSLKSVKRFRIKRVDKIRLVTVGSGKILLCTNEKILAGDLDIQSFLLGNGILMKEIGTRNGISAITFANGKSYIARTENRKIEISILESQIENGCLGPRQETVFLQETDLVTALAVTRDKLYSGSLDKTIKVWNLKNNQRIGSLVGHSSEIFSMAISDRDPLLFSSAFNGEIKLWNTDSRHCLSSIHCTWNMSAELAFSDNKLFLLAIADRDAAEIEVLDLGATHEAMFEEIAALLEDPETTRIALNLFSRMPEYAKKKIYTEHNKLLRVFFSVDPKHSEDLFLDRNGFSSSPSIKAKAIRNVLAAEKSLESKIS